MDDFGTNLDHYMLIEENKDIDTNYSILDILPWKCMNNIFSYVSTECLIKSDRVSKQWHDMVNKHLQQRYRTFDTDEWPGPSMSSFQLHLFLLRLGPGIKLLSINGCGISGSIETDLAKFDYCSELCCNLEELKLMYTENVMSFSPLVFKFKNLKSLTLSHSDKTNELTMKLINSDSPIENLTVQFDDDFTGYFLAVNTPLNIRYLAFYECWKLDSAYLKHLYKLPHLTTLKLDYIDDIWPNISDIICNLTQLRELSLTDYLYFVSDETLMEYDESRFCEALSRLGLLKHLDLSHNQFITNKVMEQIAKSCKELETLDVTECNGIEWHESLSRAGVTEEGVSAVKAACKCLIKLTADGLT